MARNLESPILLTKLFIPEPRKETVFRKRLFAKLDNGLDKKLTLISAPAGFGKSTLLSSWIKTTKLKVGWLSLDSEDNDPTSFLPHFIALIQRNDEAIGKDLADALQLSQMQPFRYILSSLINELSESSSRFILILDDFHQISSQDIHDGISFFLENQPRNVHLIISTREDPPLSLARLRALGDMNEIRASHLRFKSPEVIEFFNQKEGLDLSQKDIDALETRTEGWIAGLQLAAILLDGQADKPGLVQSFTGSNRLVMDYLLEEVMHRQPKEIQCFLLQTSILDRMTGPLCNATTGQNDGQKVLEILERANLFIVPLDNQGNWYRYHHLLADLLRQRLRVNDQGEIKILHQRASQWYEQNGLIDEAIDHALRAEDFERALHLIEDMADFYWESANIANLRRWLQLLPDEFVISSPNLSIYHAWFLRGMGKLEVAENTLRAAEQVHGRNFSRDTNIDAKNQKRTRKSGRLKFRGRAAAIRAFICSYQGDVTGIIRFGHEALEYLPEDDLNWRSITAIALGDAHGYLGDMIAAYEARIEALKACKAAGDNHFIIVANLKIAITLREQGLLQRTLEICEDQMRLANEIGLSQTRLVGFLLGIWGETLAELGHLVQGLDLTEKGFIFLENKGNMEMLGWNYLCLMKVLFSRGDLVEAEKVTQKFERITLESITPPWIPNHIAAWRARLWLAQGKLKAAQNWVESHEFYINGEPKPPSEIDYFFLFDYLVYVRTLMAQGHLNEAIDLLPHLLNAAESGGRTTKVIEILILQALAFQANGNVEQAITKLKNALTLANPGGFIRIFVDEGSVIEALLKRIITDDTKLTKYIQNILLAFNDDKRSLISIDKQALIEPLSERELEILSLIDSGLTNQQIADHLYLSKNTVKAHIRNVFQKLGVNNRIQALQEARSLNILSPK